MANEASHFEFSFKKYTDITLPVEIPVVRDDGTEEIMSIHIKSPSVSKNRWITDTWNSVHEAEDSDEALLSMCVFVLNDNIEGIEFTKADLEVLPTAGVEHFLANYLAWVNTVRNSKN